MYLPFEISGVLCVEFHLLQCGMTLSSQLSLMEKHDSLS